jgi:hypothetical protein
VVALLLFPLPASGTNSVPRGIYLLDDITGTNRLGLLKHADRPFINGFSWRLKWIDLDKGVTGPVYDFSMFDAALAQLQSFTNGTGKLTLALSAQEMPAYVLAAARETFLSALPQQQGLVLTAVPWDAGALSHYRNFARALAGYAVFDAAVGRKVPLRSHSALGQVGIGVVGLQAIRDPALTVRNIPTYTRAKFIQAVLNNIHIIQDQFPAKPTFLGYFAMSDATLSPALDSELLAAIATEFDGRDAAHPRIGLFQDVLRRNSPRATSNFGVNLLTGRATGSPILLQACGSWLTGGPCSFGRFDTSPGNGLLFGYLTYGCLYFEFYAADLAHPDFEPIFVEWEAFLRAETAATP